MTVIGLTGPTGAGKSLVARHFERRGAYLIDADKTAREVTQKGHPCLEELATAFGGEILYADGTLNRAVLASKAFATPEAKHRLEAITHPYIIERMEEKLNQRTSDVVVIDAPLLFESGLNRLCRYTIAVLAPRTLRKERIMKRDGLSDERAEERLAVQKSDEFYRARVTYCIENDGDFERLSAQIDAIIEGG